MKTIIAIIFTLSSLASDAQNLVDYGNKMMGKKVGSGICEDLLIAGMNECYPGWENRFGYNNHYHVYGERLKKFSDLQPGDVIVLMGIVNEDGTTDPNHIAIVSARVSDDVIEIIDQNHGATLKQSRVTKDRVSYSGYETTCKKFTMLFYRPS